MYDANVKRKNYEVGDLVWRNQKKNIPGLKLKIARQWTGPWVIVTKLSDVTFKIQCSKKSALVIIHGDNIKPYRGKKKINWYREIRKENSPVVLPDLSEFLATDTDENSRKYKENSGSPGSSTTHSPNSSLTGGPEDEPNKFLSDNTKDQPDNEKR